MIWLKFAFIYTLATMASLNWQDGRLDNLTVPQFNRIVNVLQKDKSSGKRIFYVNGYFVSGSGAMLIADTSLLLRNSRIPDSMLVMLAGRVNDSVGKSFHGHHFPLVKLKIEVGDSGLNVLGVHAIQ
jgi:hypothetical protein